MTTRPLVSPVIIRPSGSMCQSCMHVFVANCSRLPFETMPKLRTEKDGTIVVRCTDYQRMKTAPTQAPDGA